MVRLIGFEQRRRQRNGAQDFAVMRRIEIEVDDGDKVGDLARLVAGPDQQGILGLVGCCSRWCK